MTEKEKNIKSAGSGKKKLRPDSASVPEKSGVLDEEINESTSKDFADREISTPDFPSQDRPPEDSQNGDDSARKARLIEQTLASEIRSIEQKKYSHRSLVAMIFVSMFFGLLGGALGSVHFAPWYRASVLGQQPADKQEIRRVTLDEQSAIIDVVESSNPSVVSIVVSKDLPRIQEYFSDPFDFFFNPFGAFPREQGDSGLLQIGAGSGFIVGSDGLIMTNKHVVEDEAAEYTVITSDGKKYAAKILARDPSSDLAVVKIEARGLPTLQFGDSEKIQIGQSVIAIGNALGEFSNTVTTGIVSGTGRTVVAGSTSGNVETLQQVIQTDAAINPGNSGGPLLNLAGEVIGVNTAIDQSGQLIGFAIPAKEAKKVLDDVVQFGRVMRPFIGVRYIMLSQETSSERGLKVSEGALLVRGNTVSEPAVVAGSPADRAGLREGDVILEISGKAIGADFTLSTALREYAPGDQVVIKYIRGEETNETLLTLSEAGN